MNAMTPDEPTMTGNPGGVFRISRAFALLGGLVMLGSAALVSLDVIVRNLFSIVPFRSFELTTYAFAAAMAFSFGYALLDRKHIRIDAIYRMFPLWVQTVFDVVNLLLMLLLALALAYHGTIAAISSWEIGASSTSSLAVPLVIPQGVWAAGLLWFAFCALALTVRVLGDLVRRKFARIHAEIGIDLDQTEI